MHPLKCFRMGISPCLPCLLSAYLVVLALFLIDLYAVFKLIISLKCICRMKGKLFLNVKLFLWNSIRPSAKASITLFLQRYLFNKLSDFFSNCHGQYIFLMKFCH